MLHDTACLAYGVLAFNVKIWVLFLFWHVKKVYPHIYDVKNDGPFIDITVKN